MFSGVYQIVNQANGKRYVGSTNNFLKRWKLHRHHLARGTHHSPHLQSSWNKHGADRFVFLPILYCSSENKLFYEQRAIDSLNPEFNVLPIAGSPKGRKLSQETRNKISISRIGNKYTLGYRHTPEARAKQAAAKLGNTYTKGKKRSPEAIAKTAAAHRGMKRSAETRARISAAARRRWGRSRNAEARV